MLKLELEEKLPSFDELIGDLSEQEVRDFLEVSEEVSVPAGTEIFKQGTEGDALYIIEKGVISIYKSAYGKYVEIARLQKGNIVGEMSFFVQRPHSATAKALTDCVLIKITEESFRKLYVKNVDLAFKILVAINKVLIYRLDKRNKEIVRLKNV